MNIRQRKYPHYDPSLFIGDALSPFAERHECEIFKCGRIVSQALKTVNTTEIRLTAMDFRRSADGEHQAGRSHRRSTHRSGRGPSLNAETHADSA
jgi:hypothetical protein